MSHIRSCTNQIKSNQIFISPAAIILFEAYVYKKENRHHYTNISHTRHRFAAVFFGGGLAVGVGGQDRDGNPCLHLGPI